MANDFSSRFLKLREKRLDRQMEGGTRSSGASASSVTPLRSPANLMSEGRRPASFGLADRKKEEEREDKHTGSAIEFDSLSTEKERAQKSAADTSKELRLSNARENLARRAGFPVNGINIDQERERQSDLSKKLQGYRRDLERIDYIQGYQDVTRKDNFGGQFRASYDVGQMGQDEAMAWKDYLSNPTPQNRLYAEAVSKVREDYIRRNQDALDDNATLPWISQDLAQYLPQLKGQTIAGAKGALGGAAAGTVIPVAGTAAGAKAGYVAGRAAYGFDTMQGFAFKSLLDAGLDEQTAREAAMDEAFISSLIEGGDAAIDLLTLGGGKVISALFKKSAQTGAKITKPMWKQILSGGAAVLGNALGEGAQEWVQEGVSLANQNRGGTGALDLIGATGGQVYDALSGRDPDALAQMNDAGAAGFRIGLMVGGGSRLTNAALESAINRQNGMAGSDVEDMASTFGPSGSRAFTNAVENGAPATGIYSDFVNAYNSGLHGREMPEATSDAISAGQMQAAYYAGQNDAGEKGGASRVSDRTADDSSPERQADLLEQLRQQSDTITNRQAERLMGDQTAMETLRSSAGLNLSAQDTMSKRRDAVKQAFARYARENAAQPTQETVQAKQAVAGEQVLDYAKEAGDVLRNGIFTDVYGSAFERTGISYSDLDRALTKISRNEIDTSDPVVAAVMSVLDGTEEQVATASGVEAQATKLAQNTVGGEIDASLLNSFGESGRKAFANSARNSTNPEDIYPEFSRAYVEGLTGAGQRDGMSEIAQAAYYAGQNDAEAALISERAEAGSANIHSDARFVPNEYSAEMDTDTVNYLDALAKATGTKIQMSAATGPKGKNGWYGDDGFIYIAVDADKPAIEVAKHEITHRLQKIAPEEYRQYRDYAMNALLEEGSIADLVELYKARYAEVYADMTDEKAMDEIAADFTERLIVDPARFARLSQDNRSVARKLLDAIKHFVSKVKSAFSDSARRNAAARDTFGVDLGTLEEAARLWEQALAAGAERVRNTQASSLQTQRADATMGNTRYSLKEDDNGQKAGTDRDGVRGVGNAERRARGGRQAAASERGSGRDRAEVRGGKISFGSRSAAEQNRLTEILVTPVYDSPAWRDIVRSFSLDDAARVLSDNIDRNTGIIQKMMQDIPGFSKAVDDARAYANRGRTVRGRSIGAAVEHATNKDSFGRTLSKEQQAYFAGSVARDPYGNLLRLFHGSRTDVFTEFDLYEGVWLTEDRNYAKNYADLRSLQSQNISLEDQIYSDDRLKIFEMYADISNPVDLGEINDVLTAGKIRELAKSLGVRYNELRGIAKPYMNENIYSLTRSREFIDLVGRQGFDGMMATEGGVETWCAIGSPDQVKLTSNETPTADPDIRYSLKGTSQLQHQVQNLEERNRYLQEQLKRTKGIKTDRKKTASFARNLLTAYESQYDRDTLTGELLDIYDEIANSRDGVDMDGLRTKAREVAGRVLEQSVRVDAEVYNEYSSLRNYLRTTKIKVPKSIHADLEPVGGYNGFRRGNSSRMKLSVSEGMDIDTVYRELSQQYPGLFDEQAYTNPADQLINISDVLDSIQPVVSNPYSSDMEMAARFVANEILEGYFDVPQQRPTFADRQDARVEAARAAGNRRLTEQKDRGKQQAEKLKDRYEQRIAKLRQQGREQVQSAVSRERQRRADQVQAIKEKYTSRDIAARERRNARELRNRIQRHVQALSTRLLNPTDSRNVPEVLRRPVAALLEAVNLESNYSLDPDTIRPIARKDGKYGGVTGKRLSADDERGVATKRTQAFIELRNAYQQIMNEGDGEMVIDPALLGDQASGFQGSFDKVISMHDKRLADMSVQELETVLQTVRAVEFSISTAGKNLAQSKFSGTLDWAMAMREENRGKRPRNTTERHYTIDLLTPLTYFSRFGDSGVAVYRMLRNAQDAQQQMITDLSEETAGIVTPAEAREMRYKTHQFTTQSNQELTLTTAQIMSLYELSKRKQAQEHIYTGGIYQPAVPGTNIKRGTEAIHLTPYDVGKILDTLTPDQIMVADRLQQIMATTLADLGNEASMKAYGYKKFTGADYWPITSAREGIRSTVENGGMNTRAVANIGLAKSTVPNANNPLDIKDAFTTFTEHAADMTDYAAYLLPMEDANRLYNFRFKDSGQAIKGLLDRTGGPRSTNYWERLMEDIQNGTSARSDSELSGLAGRIISRTKGASVGANLRVIAQQPTAYLRALAVLSPTNLSKGLAGGATRGSGWVKALKWAPIAQKKQVGGFEIGSGVGLEQELFGDLTKGAKLAVNRISNAAMWGAGKMDEITWGKIWNACEWEVTSRNKELVKGSDAFYKAVAELFTRVIDESQVVDGVMQRSQVMRSNSDLNKMATAFMGEPTMSLNLMMRSYDNAVRATSPAARSAARKKFARAGMALVLSGVVNAAVQSLVDAGRDDDKDKKYWERFISAFTGLTGEEESLADKVSAAALRSNISGNLNPVGQIPYANDVLSMLQGYDVYRMDAEAIGDFITAGQNVVNNIGGTGTRTPAYALKELANAAAKVFGISVGNVLRDAAGILNSYAVETDDAGLMYEIDKVGYNISNSSNKSRFLDIAFKARETGYTETYNRIAKDLIAAGVLEDMDDFEDQMARRLKATGTFTSEQDKVETEISTKVQSSSLYKGIDQEYKEKLMDKVEAYSYAVTMHQQYPDYELGKSYDWVEKVQSGSSVGLTPDEYILFDFAYNNVITSDKDEDGNSIPGSKQDKIIDFMEGMNLTDEEWNYLWHSVYTSDKNNPRK